MTRLLYVVFFLSGAAGLVYETIWSRHLALFVGHSAYAQVIVLTIFLGGLALGSLVAGRLSERIRRPLLAYAGVEALVGLLGLAFPDAFSALTGLAYREVLPALGTGLPGTLFRWGLAGAVILPASALMGTTFPLMGAALLRRAPERPGRTVGLLYFWNSLGAAAGALVAGFVLVGLLGLDGTIHAAGVLNLVLAAAAVGIHRWGYRPSRTDAPAAVPIEAPPGWLQAPRSRVLLRRGLLSVAFGTAVASFVYEIAWIRMLSLVLGSATHAFELMLSAFILGIALGALWIEKRLDGLRDPLTVLAAVQWIMGFAALATLPLYIASFEWTAILLQSLEQTGQGYAAFNLARYGIALAVMLPSTFCAGMTLPLLTRILVVSGGGEREVGMVYGVNTLGSIVGVVAAALILLPLLGVKNLLLTGAALDMLLGAGVLFLRRAPGPAGARRRRLALGTTAVVVTGVALAVTLDPLLLSSGVYRTGTIPGAGTEMVYFHHGRTATVSVIDAGEWRTLATNGKTDASLRRSALDPDSMQVPRPLMGDEPTQLLLGLLPLAHHPAPERVAVIGQGSGMTSHFILGDPAVTSLRTIDIEPSMIEGSRAFYPANRRVFDDPRSEFVVDDARAVLESDPRTYDAIVSEPSNPWVSGVSSLFTVEFYGRVRDHLAPGGVFVQWIQAYEIDEELILGVMAGIHRVFPSYRVYTSTGDLLVVAGEAPELGPADWGRVLSLPGLAPDLAPIQGLEPLHLEMLEIGNRNTLGPLLERWPEVNSDRWPVLDLGAERARFVGARADELLELGTAPLSVASLHLPRIEGLPAGVQAPFPQIPRAEGIALNRALRAAVGGVSLEELDSGEELADRLYEVQRFRSAIASGRPPGDWLRWTREARVFLGHFHEGLRGVADEGIFRELEEYARETGAPAPVPDALAFLRHTAAWEMDGVLRSGEALVAELETGREWLPPDEILDAVVAAHLALEDERGARRAFERIHPLTRRPVDDIRSRLLAAHLAAAGGRP